MAVLTVMYFHTGEAWQKLGSFSRQHMKKGSSLWALTG